MGEMARPPSNAQTLGRWVFFSGLSMGLVTFVTFVFHEWFHLTEQWSFLTALLLVSTWNFFAIRYFIYGGNQRPIGRQFVEFVSSSLAFRGFEFLSYWILIDVSSINYLLATAVVLPASFIGKYLLYSTFVFKQRSMAEQSDPKASH